jgi:hypothetical protein
MKLTSRRGLTVLAALLAVTLATLLLALLLDAPPSLAADFVTNRAVLTAGQSVTSRSSTNGNRTSFHFVEVTKPPGSEAKAAFVQWAPLMPKAGAYRNGALVDADRPVRLWINGVWYSLAFDGEKLDIR